MLAYTPDQWLVLLLAFVLGLILGMALLASPKWKQRYRDEVRRREALETENEQLRRDAREMDSLRQAAVRDEARRRDDEAGRRDAESDSLREAAARDEARRLDDEASLREAAARDEARRRDEDAGPATAAGSATPDAPDRSPETGRVLPPGS
jgi:uncharacterized membrane-anchored protein YhcB (DUF1043 family)